VTPDGVDQVELLERNARTLAVTDNGSVAIDFRAREIKTPRVRVPTATG